MKTHGTEARRYRICLIVDHPMRDLDGMTLLASELAGRDAEVFLVPMYEAQEVFTLAPDMVLVNYVRFANAGFVEACDRLGITVGVLDTEGGVRQDLDEYAAQVAPFVKRVRLYCVWGRAQFAALDRGAGLTPGALQATGCPRYDWAIEPWRNAIARPAGMSDPSILINTNFPILRPRFQSRQREIEQNVAGMGYERDRVLRFIEESEHARAEVIAAVVELARALPSVAIILRPHPFEDRHTYDEAFAAHANVRIEQSGPVFEWIRYSRLVVHFNCSTAIDSMLLGVEAVHLDWIDAPQLSQPTSAGVSQRVRSVGELIDLARRAVAGDSLTVSPELTAARRSAIEEYFVDDDGRAALRVADAILAVLVRSAARPTPGWRYAVRALKAQGSLRAATKYIVSAIAGASMVQRLRRASVRLAAESKRFSVADVASIVRRLGAVHLVYADIEVGLSPGPDTSMPHLTEMRSVRIARREAAQRAAR